MRQRIAVQYHNEAGTRESGVDAGGLFKEFWTDLSAIAFDPNYALFRTTEGKGWKHWILVLNASSNPCFAQRQLHVPKSFFQGSPWFRPHGSFRIPWSDFGEG